jgi:hypothetical protein
MLLIRKVHHKKQINSLCSSKGWAYGFPIATDRQEKAMFNLIANAMFEATRVSAPPDRPVRSRWFAGRSDDIAGLSGRQEAATRPGRAGSAPGEGPVSRVRKQ